MAPPTCLSKKNADGQWEEGYGVVHHLQREHHQSNLMHHYQNASIQCNPLVPNPPRPIPNQSNPNSSLGLDLIDSQSSIITIIVSVIICRCTAMHSLPVHGGCHEPFRDLLYFIQDLIGSIGGYLGLFLGWSVMSIVTAAPVWCTLLSPVFCKKSIDNWIKAKSCRSPSKLSSADDVFSLSLSQTQTATLLFSMIIE